RDGLLREVHGSHRSALQRPGRAKKGNTMTTESEAEDKPFDPYESWKADPTPDNLATVVDTLKPLIGYQLANLGAHDDPILKNKARIVAAQAIRKYDPASGASLPTWVSSQMQQLRRFRRQAHAVLKVPERIQMD